MKGPGVVVNPQQPAWTPGQEQLDRSRLLSAMREWGYESLADLHRASVDDPEWYWRAATADLGVEFSTPFTAVRDERDGKPFPRWFVDGRLNVADLCAHRHAAGPLAGKTAVVYDGDSGVRRTLTYAELSVQVRRFAGNLQQLGVGAGDRVALFMPVVPEAVVAFLGCAMVGAVVVPAFSGYAAETLATRMQDSQAVLLVTADGTTRRGKKVPLKQVADEALAVSPTVRKVVVVRHLDDGTQMTAGRDVFWDELDATPPQVRSRPMDPNDALALIYTSGTTGRPKGIVLSQGGFAVKTANDFGYGFDVHDDDVVGWITDLGWLVGPMMIVGPLQLGATAVLIEGVPTYPESDRLWATVAREHVTVQGIAPTAARALMAGGANGNGLPELRSFISTGEPWDEPTWHWLFEQVGGGRRPIINYSGGTETSGGLLVGYPFLPIEPGAFNAPVIGVDAAVVDETGVPLTGVIGELAVFNTWPGMTHGFWNDRERYLDTYWRRFDGVWVHGDLASIDQTGAWRIHGRSDDTLKISGRRVGPAEIEATLLKDERITQVAVIGIPDPQRGQRPVAFVVTSPGADPQDVAAVAAVNAGRAFAPIVHVVQTLPKTRNGKIMRRAIRARYLGSDPGDLTALDPTTPLDSIPEEEN